MPISCPRDALRRARSAPPGRGAGRGRAGGVAARAREGALEAGEEIEHGGGLEDAVAGLARVALGDDAGLGEAMDGRAGGVFERS